MSTLNKGIKNFLENPTIKKLIESDNWSEVYDRCSIYIRHILTKVLLDAGINPLEYLPYVPSYYLENGLLKGRESLVLPKHIQYVGQEAFSGCTALKSVQLNAGVEEICALAFHSCGLEEVTIPGSVTDIGAHAFKKNKDLKRVVIEEGTNYINQWAFGYCPELTEIQLPSSLIQLEDNIFTDCPKLKVITFMGTPTEWTKINKGELWGNSDEEKTLVCPRVGKIGVLYGMDTDGDFIG